MIDIRKSARLWLSAIAVVASLFITVSLLSHDVRDGDYYPQAVHIYNYGGKQGAILAIILYQWLGVAAYLVPMSILSLVIMASSQKWSARFCKICTLWILILTAWICPMLSFCEKSTFNSHKMPSSGGILGLFAIRFLRHNLGSPATTAIVVLTNALLLACCFTLWFEYHILRGKKLEEKSSKSDHDGQIIHGHHHSRNTGGGRQNPD